MVGVGVVVGVEVGVVVVVEVVVEVVVGVEVGVEVVVVVEYMKHCIVFFLSGLVISISTISFSALAGNTVDLFVTGQNTTSAPANEIIHLTYEKLPPKKTRIETGIITAYTLVEGCGNPQCLNASGYRPQRNKSVACPRKIPLGTEIKIGGRMYQCDDHYAKTLSDRFDLYFGETQADYEAAKLWGKQIKEVTIIED